MPNKKHLIVEPNNLVSQGRYRRHSEKAGTQSSRGTADTKRSMKLIQKIREAKDREKRSRHQSEQKWVD